MEFEYFHFHIYFNEEQKAQVEKITHELRQIDGIKIGRIWDKPAGPHPIGSCQISVHQRQFEAMINWFLLNRDGLDIFVHAISGDDLKDHTDYALAEKSLMSLT